MGEARGGREQSAHVPLDGALDSSIPQTRDEEKFPPYSQRHDGREGGSEARQVRFLGWEVNSHNWISELASKV